MDRNDITLKTYDEVAQEYEKLHKSSGEPIELKKLAGYLKPGAKILDAGCGFGMQLKYFSKLGFDTYGFDASKELLKLARKNAPKAKIVFADLREKLPYKDNFFDGVIAKTTLHHLEPRGLPFALSEIRRVLKPRGVFFVSWKEGDKEMMTKEEVAAGRERFYNLKNQKEVEDIIKEAGFEISESYIFDWNKRYVGKRQFSHFIVVFARK